MLVFYEVREQAKLIRSDRNRNSACLEKWRVGEEGRN